MLATTTSTFNTLSMAKSSSLFFSPSVFVSKPPHQHLLTLHRPIKLHLSCSVFVRPKTRFSLTVPSVAQTSDWAQQDEGEESNPATTVTESDQAEPTWDNEGAGSSGGYVSDLESESEGTSTEAFGEVGGGLSDADGEGAFSQLSEDAKLFVGNLPYDVDSEKLAMLFEDAGTVEIAEVIYNRETGLSRGFGFVTMSTVEEAEKGVETLSGYDLDGRQLTVNKAAPRGSRPDRPPRETAHRIFVSNLPWDVDNARLEQVFSEYGKVKDARIVTELDTGRSRGFGFVTMDSEAGLNDAIAALDGQEMGGRTLRVNVAIDKSRRRSY